MEAKTIFHITTESEWMAAQNKGTVSAPSLMAEGFIHCSLGRQLGGVLARYFALEKSVTLLALDAAALQAPLKYEGDSDHFPHVYGTIPLAAVQKALSLNRKVGESWESTLKRECPGAMD